MRRRSERGAVIVEFAMVLPLLAIMLLGILDLSMMVYNKAVITNASREGCRFGIRRELDRTNTAAIDTQIQTVVNNYCQQHLVGLVSNNPVVAVTWPSPADLGDPLQVTVTYQYGFLGLHTVSSYSNPFTLGAKTVMLLE